MNEILLVEDNSDDIELTLRAFRKSNVANEVIIVRDGVEALDYLFATGQYAGRDPNALPQVVLLDLQLPRVGGLEVLQRVRSHPKTKLLPVVILTSSTEERDLMSGYSLGLYWLLLNQRAPTTAQD
jgi:two-component system, response regulator